MKNAPMLDAVPEHLLRLPRSFDSKTLHVLYLRKNRTRRRNLCQGLAHAYSSNVPFGEVVAIEG